MLGTKTALALPLAFVATVCIAADVGTTVSWSQVRQAIADDICVVEEPRAPSGYFLRYGKRSECGGEAASTDLAAAIDQAFADASPIMMSVRGVFTTLPPDLERLYAIEDPAERDRRVDEALLGHEPFMSTLLPRLEEALADRGLVCRDCPEAPSKPVRRLGWDEFARYVSAFILPNPDARSFHVCSGVDAAKRVEDDDPNLLRAGFLAAWKSPTVRQRTGDVLAEWHDKRPADLDDDAWVDMLYAAVAERVRSDPEIRGEACAALGPYSKDLGVALTDCPQP